MNQINDLVGSQIRAYRKAKGLTLQQLADSIHKSRGTVSKYENGEIVIDVQTLYDIAQILEVSPNELFDYQPNQIPRSTYASKRGSSPFYNARRLYFYFYDGRYGRLKDGVIDIVETVDKPEQYEATLSVSTVTPEGRMSETFYHGDVLYSDMLIRFSFVNQCNALEEDLLYIFNPLEVRDTTEGIFCGISSSDLMPCAFRCLVSLTMQPHSEALKNRLLLTKKELKRWQELNMFMVDNHSY